MEDIYFTRSGIIKEIDDKSITVIMSDTGDSIEWPIDGLDNNDKTLRIGNKLDLKINIIDKQLDEDLSLMSTDVETEESLQKEERMRKELESLIN